MGFVLKDISLQLNDIKVYPATVEGWPEIMLLLKAPIILGWALRQSVWSFVWSSWKPQWLSQEAPTAPLFGKPGYGDSECCQWRSLQTRMCKKSGLQNGKLIPSACSCFPREPSYKLRKGNANRAWTYSSGAGAGAIFGSGLAERDKRWSSCPGLGLSPVAFFVVFFI